jgi:hypothetical protein
LNWKGLDKSWMLKKSAINNLMTLLYSYPFSAVKS